MNARVASAKPDAIHVTPTDDGIHLSGTILWLDARASGDLSFLSSAATPIKTTVPQVIATEETVKILEIFRKKPDALICQYNRPFSIGRFKLELLPSGCMLGGASLYLESDKGRILYAPSLQTQRVAVVRQMQLKRAQTLILGAWHPDPESPLPNRKRERENLLAAVKDFLAKKQYPIIFCHALGSAQEITALLSEQQIPLAVSTQIYRINKIYESYGSTFGAYSKFTRRTSIRERVLILPLPEELRPGIRQTILDRPLLHVEESLTQTSSFNAFRDADQRFVLSSTSDGPDLREVISIVAPKELHILGPYAKRYAECFKGTTASVKIFPLFPNDQPTLF